MKKLEDNIIVELYLKRDEAAINETRNKYGARLRSLSCNIVKDVHTTEECENDTYMQAWSCIPPHEPRDYLYAFLARIIRHISLNRCRESNRLKRNAFICELSNELEECIPSSNNIDKLIDDLAFAEFMNNFLQEIDVEKRNIFLRRYWYFDSIDNISKLFGISKSKVKTTLFRIRNNLREHLEKEGYTV